MASIPSQPSITELQSRWKPGFKKSVNSRWTFVVLQVLDLTTTLIAFHMGAMEANPLVAHFTATFGWLRGLVISKLIAIGIAMGVRRLIWVVNIFYAGIILWNLLILLSLHPK
jgi:hypothetical protein